MAAVFYIPPRENFFILHKKKDVACSFNKYKVQFDLEKHFLEKTRFD